MLLDLLTVIQMILLGPLVILRLFWVLILIPYKSFLLLMCGFKLGYYTLLVSIFWWYWYMLIVFLCLYVHIFSILYLCETLSHRICHFYLGMIATDHIRYVYWPTFRVFALACSFLSLELMWAFSISFFITSNCALLVFLGLVSWMVFGN